MIQVGALRMNFLVDPADSGGRQSVFEVDVPADGKVPAPHSHDSFDETIYGVEGATVFTVDGAESEVGAGDAIFIPRGAIHGFVNRSGDSAKFLAIASPGLMTPAYFEELAAVISASAGPPDPATIGEVMTRHGLTPAP